MDYSLFTYITWNAAPQIFKIGSMEVRWYGLLFALGFLIDQRILFHIFKKENKPEKDVETLTIYLVIATIIGARLGHCIFYQPDVYLTSWKGFLEIFKIWEGGLASHGAAIGILVSLYLYTHYDIRIKLSQLSFKSKKQKRPGQSYLWIVDRIVILVSLSGALIRLGNLMNSEIFGKPTTLPWGFIFVRAGETVPRHPTQIYESLFCVILFLTLYFIWKQKKSKLREGLIFGIFLTTLFTFRFLIEFLKENQVDFENKLSLNMGQLLSIPLIIIGIIILFFSLRKKSQGTGS